MKWKLAASMVLVLVWLCAAVGEDAPAERDDSPKTAEPPAWERYEAVVRLNVFVRERRSEDLPAEPRFVVPTRPSTPVAPPYILRGVVVRDGTPVAFVENLFSQEVEVVKAGDSLDSGRVSAVTLDSLEYTRNEQKLSLKLGGGSVAGAAGGAVSGGNGDRPSAAEMSILEKLRLKRQSQVDKGSTP